MANNPYVNKVIYGETALLDLTSDTVSADKVLSGATFHSKTGASDTGIAGASVTGTNLLIPSSIGSVSGNNLELVEAKSGLIVLTSSAIISGSRYDPSGIYYANDERITSEYAFPVDGDNRYYFINSPVDWTYSYSSWEICFYEYENDTYLGSSSANSWHSFPFIYKRYNSRTNKVKFAIRKNNNAVISPNDILRLAMYKLT